MKLKLKLNEKDQDMVEFWDEGEECLWCVSHPDIFGDPDTDKRITLTTDFITIDVIKDH